MFQQKVSKGQKLDGNSFVYHNPHSIGFEMRENKLNYIQLVSIDPARDNFAIRIERRYPKERVVQTVVQYKTKFSQSESGNNTDFKEITDFLDLYAAYWIDTLYVVIEKQPPLKLYNIVQAQHVKSYFMIRMKNMPLLPLIIDQDPKIKGKYLDAPAYIGDRGIKKWSVKMAYQLLETRQDTFCLDVLNRCPTKLDDLTDTICQLEAFCIYHDWAGIHPLTPYTPIVEI